MKAGSIQGDCGVERDVYANDIQYNKRGCLNQTMELLMDCLRSLVVALFVLTVSVNVSFSLVMSSIGSCCYTLTRYQMVLED